MELSLAVFRAGFPALAFPLQSPQCQDIYSSQSFNVKSLMWNPFFWWLLTLSRRMLHCSKFRLYSSSSPERSIIESIGVGYFMDSWQWNLRDGIFSLRLKISSENNLNNISGMTCYLKYDLCNSRLSQRSLNTTLRNTSYIKDAPHI